MRLHYSTAQAGRLPSGLGVREPWANRLAEAKQQCRRACKPSCWCGFRRFRCWLPRSNVQVACQAKAGPRVLPSALAKA